MMLTVVITFLIALFVAGVVVMNDLPIAYDTAREPKHHGGEAKCGKSGRSL